MHFHVLEEQSESFPEITDDDEFPSDDLVRVSEWVLTKFQQYTTHEKYDVTHCNISSYGASLVHLDGLGKRIKHFYNYLKPFPENCRQQFLSDYDSQHTLLADTASPFLGMLNSGLQLYWLKYEKKALFQSITTSLHLPQYFTYLLTGKTFTDITSVGCHTLLWDFKRQDYHRWVDAEDFRKLFPPLYAADHVFDFKVNHQAVKIGIGVHDSSAALMPYLATQQEPFLLLSSGTWNICFNPFNHNPLTSHELAGDCLCFLTPMKKGTPVKASRIFLGHEHDQQTTALNKFFATAPDYYKSIAFNEDLYKALVSLQPGTKEFFPIAMEGTGPIPQKQSQRTDYTQFENFDQAYHQCIRYLVKWQLLSMNLIDPDKKIKNVIVVGGFTKNPLFLEILKREDPHRKILISDHPRASALGAAWLVAGEASYRGKAGLLSVSGI
jgi:sugar (pentulose or hexulose) kinase